MSGAVIWFTGLPGAGKTTLAEAVAAVLRKEGVPVALLDSDQMRAALVPDPGHDADGRNAFYLTLANLAAMLAHQGLAVLVAATANRAQWRAHARALAPYFMEVYVSTSANTCRQRDPKGLWAAADAGSITTLPGVGAPFEAPAAPDITARGGEDGTALAKICTAVRHHRTANGGASSRKAI